MGCRTAAVMAALCVILTMTGPSAAKGEPAAPEPQRDPRNVRITLEIGRLEDGRKSSVRTYAMLTTTNGEMTGMSTESRVPIPTNSFHAAQAGGDRPVPVTSFTYQNVGVSAKVRASMGGAGGILLQGQIETSYLQDAKSGTESGVPPAIGTLSQELNVLLTDGAPVRITSVGDPGPGSLYLEIRADLMK